MKLDIKPVQSTKIEELKTSEAVGMPSDIQKLDGDAKEGQEDIKETGIKTQRKTDSKTHLITFMGNGVWMDNNGVAWSRDKRDNTISDMTFSTDEIADREDIRFMISYGAMKEVII